MNEINKLFMKSSLLHSRWCEVWLPIKGYPQYEISSKGRVQNTKSKRILKPFVDGGGSHTVTLNSSGKKKKSKSHRLVAKAFLENTDHRPMVDHIDNNPTNNDVSNLRWATRSQNGMNSSKSSNNTSGITGVSWCKVYKKWRAFITVDGTRKHLGYLKTIEAAKKARKKAVNSMFKEFAFKSWFIAKNKYTLKNTSKHT